MKNSDELTIILDKLSDELKEEFFEHMIPFWQRLKDNNYGGFYGLMDQNLKLDKEAEKGCILNSRILWFFSTAYTCFRDESFLKSAKAAYDFLKEHFIDKEEGGVYWSVDYDGCPADETKHTYNQSFAIYGLAAYYEASSDREALDLAFSLMDIVESKCRDKDGYLEAFTKRFEKDSNEKLSENGVMAERTMNTLLHIMEAYTELYRVSKNEKLRENICEILKIFREKVYNPDKERLEVFFDKDYNSLIDLHSYGHDIEAAWLIDRTVEVFGFEGTKYDMSDITKVLTRKIYEVAYDGNSVPAECEKGVVLQTRVWWVECEAIIGFLNGYQKDTEKDYYLDAAVSVWDYTRRNMVDKRAGSEWYNELDEENNPIPGMAIADPWKCPYHNGRMFIEVIKRCEAL